MSNLMLSVSGCRGVFGETLTPEVAAKFAGAFGSFLVERAGGKPVKVVLGRDGRRGSEMVRAGAAAGLMGAGCNVLDLGVAMTPTTAVMTDAMARSSKTAAGLIVTASHNPQSWIGLKCLLAEGGEHGSAACAPPPDVANAIIERFQKGAIRNATWSGVGTYATDESAVEEHIDRVMEAMEAGGFCELPSTIGESLKVALDSVNASGVDGGRVGLESLGCEEILHLGSDATGIFPHPPEPTRENLSAPGGLCDAVRESGSDVGFAQDPDADRLAIIDEKGNYIGEEYTLALCAMALLEAQSKSGAKGDLVLATNLSTSRMLDDVAAKFGARVERTPVGEAHVVSAMKRLAHEGKTIVCGGEGNGGIIWPRVTYVRDSLAGMALILWLLSPQSSGRRRTISELVAGLPSYAIEKRKVDLAKRELAQPVLDKLSKHYAAQRIDTRDGVWVDFTKGPLAGKAWLHVRASNTEPIMRLIAEAPTATDATRLLDDAAKVAG